MESSYGGLFIPSRPECVKVSERQRHKERFHNTTKFVDIAQLSEMLTLMEAKKHITNAVWKWILECPCSLAHSWTLAKFPKLRAYLTVTQHCGVASCPVIVNWPSLHFRLMEKTVSLLQLMTDMCFILSQSQFTAKLRRQLRFEERMEHLGVGTRTGLKSLNKSLARRWGILNDCTLRNLNSSCLKIRQGQNMVYGWILYEILDSFSFQMMDVGNSNTWWTRSGSIYTTHPHYYMTHPFG